MSRIGTRSPSRITLPPMRRTHSAIARSSKAGGCCAWIHELASTSDVMSGVRTYFPRVRIIPAAQHAGKIDIISPRRRTTDETADVQAWSILTMRDGARRGLPAHQIERGHGRRREQL